MKGLSGEAGGGPAGRDDANNMRFLFFPAQYNRGFTRLCRGPQPHKAIHVVETFCG